MINIEIDGIPLTADPTKMIIEVADEAGIDIPRFCYHKKLSIAANCRMCLVEVDKSNKALPACATPISEGMKVFTSSAVAIAAQRGVMEFLLINHPLDCPICDQGGECELQDLSMGYGAGVGRFSEGKRVVKDKDIGALIKTDMTRCIHCTRCVRFGQEIAGIKELGATGRGEHMEIGTYIEESLASELSGNIIDLCPVGALTSKPFRYKARAWELSAHPGVSPHDSVGSNIEIHTRRDEVMRVVPRENELLNETWLSDRDRFSYLGLQHEERATTPMIKKNDQWQEVDWQTALNIAVDGIKSVKEQDGAQQIAGIASPMSSLEESYLFQKFLRGLEIENIDHRLRQQDFSDKSVDYNQDMSLKQIEQLDTILLIGCHIRAEEPILAHRLRQATMTGTKVNDINFFTSDLLMPVTIQIGVNIDKMLVHLSGIAKILMPVNGDEDSAWLDLLVEVVPTAEAQTIAKQLSSAENGMVMLGALANNHPHAAKIRTLSTLICRLTSSQLIVLPTANSKGSMLAGVFPQKDDALNTQESFQANLKSYVLLGIEPELDCADPRLALTALRQADFVVALQPYVTETMLTYADVILPVSSFSESSGTFVSIDGQWQSYTGAVTPKGESRPAWKVLRVLANLAEVGGFDYISSQDINDEIRSSDAIKMASKPYWPVNTDTTSSGVEVISEVPMYQTDSIVRRSSALANTIENKAAIIAKMNMSEAEKHGLINSNSVVVCQDKRRVTMDFAVDNSIADGCIHMPAGVPEMSQFAAAFSIVTVEANKQSAKDD